MDSRTQNKYGIENESNVVELSTNDFTGTSLTNKRFNDKICLLKVYAPWCGYCIRMADDMNFLAKSLGKKDIPVLSINYEQNKELVGAIGSNGFPTMFIVDKSGNLHKVNMGSRSVVEILTAIQSTSKTLNN